MRPTLVPSSRLAVGAALVVALALGAPAVAAADPPSVGTFQVNPDSGPVSSTITYSGFCGFPASELGLGLLGPNGPIVFEGVFLKTNRFGHFSVKETVPLVAPGVYIAAVVCAFDSEGNPVLLPLQPFEVTVG
jgi:hypothetical protein